MTVRASLMLVVLVLGDHFQSAPPPQPAPATPRPSGAAPPPPVLPADAQRVMDQFTRQQADVQREADAVINRQRQDVIQQLIGLRDVYVAARRPEDAAAVHAHIVLLQRAAAAAEGKTVDTPERPLPVSMVTYRDRVGQTFTFTVTGSADALVYGTNVYTDDTPLEGAAVHAGVLRSGQTGQVRVTVLAGQSAYVGSRKNGIESGNYGAYPGSYRIEIGSGTSSRPTSIANFRGRIGEIITVPLVGNVSGSVWGVDVYTDDSSLAAAAVHAGVLTLGEFGFVKISMLDGQSSYPGVGRNGVTSESYGEWNGSFRIERAPQPWVIQLPDDVDGSGLVQLTTLRGQPGVSFSVQVIGTPGAVRGTDIYSDDSSIAAAAVHAGVLKAGEKGYVRITILPGQQSYTGTEQHGVRSGGGGEWKGSFRVERGTGPIRR